MRSSPNSREDSRRKGQRTKRQSDIRRHSVFSRSSSSSTIRSVNPCVAAKAEDDAKMGDYKVRASDQMSVERSVFTAVELYAHDDEKDGRPVPKRDAASEQRRKGKWNLRRRKASRRFAGGHVVTSRVVVVVVALFVFSPTYKPIGLQGLRA